VLLDVGARPQKDTDKHAPANCGADVPTIHKNPTSYNFKHAATANKLHTQDTCARERGDHLLQVCVPLLSQYPVVSPAKQCLLSSESDGLNKEVPPPPHSFPSFTSFFKGVVNVDWVSGGVTWRPGGCFVEGEWAGDGNVVSEVGVGWIDVTSPVADCVRNGGGWPKADVVEL
jgi:hypothetical protein